MKTSLLSDSGTVSVSVTSDRLLTTNGEPRSILPREFRTSTERNDQVEPLRAFGRELHVDAIAAVGFNVADDYKVAVS